MNFGRFRVSKFLSYALIASLLSWIPVQGFLGTLPAAALSTPTSSSITQPAGVASLIGPADAFLTSAQVTSGGWTSAGATYTDDGSVAVSFPSGFTTIYNNTSYSSVYVGSNSYLTFGSGSNQYAGLTGSSPAIPGIFLCAADNHFDHVYYKASTDGLSFTVRFEGGSGDADGSPTTTYGSGAYDGKIIWEATFYKGQNYVDTSSGTNTRCSVPYDRHNDYMVFGAKSSSGWLAQFPGFSINQASAITGVSAASTSTAYSSLISNFRITTPAAPTAPLTPLAVPGNASATVSWSPENNDFGNALTVYTVTSSPGGKSCTSTGALSCVVTGLTNGTAYTFTVTAANAVGTGAASVATSSVTPEPVCSFTTSTSGLYSVVTFAAQSVCDWLLPGTPSYVAAIVVGGGGGGGASRGGGGGGGGVYTNSAITFPNGANTSFTVSVGSGGAPSAAAACSNAGGANAGSSSSLSWLTNTVVANGGGGGGGTGGSGGAGGSVTVNGVTQSASSSISPGSSGGSGAAASGNGGNGGAGFTSTLTGSSVTYGAGAGGGGWHGTGGTAGSGAGAGGNDSGGGSANGTAGTAGLGGGGGGGSACGAAASGGSGTVVIIYASQAVVTFNANGATGSPSTSSATATNGGSVTLATQGSMANGSIPFGGWNTQPDGSGTNYLAGATFTPNSTLTLYANWSSTLTYDANGATGGSAPSSQIAAGGVATSLANNTGTLVKTGFTFGGWNTAADGSGTTYSAGGAYTPVGNATLYAQWNSVITFNVNGATTGTASSPTITAINSLPITLATTGTMTKSGYLLANWNTLANGTGTAYSPGSSYTSAGTTTLYAIWQLACSPAISYAGGNEVMTFSSATTCAYVVPAGVTSINTLVVGGGGGGGSNVGNGGGGGGISAATNVSVTPGQVLSITVGAGGATATAGSSSSLVVGATTYSAGGGAGGTTWTTGSATCTAGVGKTAGGTGSTANGSAGGGGVTTQPNATMCNGVVGTSNSTSGSSVIYGSGGGGGGYNSITSPVGGLGGGGVANNGAGNGGNYVSSVSAAGASGVNGQGGGGGGGSAGGALGGAGGSGTVLIAFPFISSVTFSPNGGSGSALSPSVIAASAGAPITTSDVGSLSYTGFTFSGWNTSADGTGTNVPVLSSYTPQGPVTLYAQWDYTLTYNGTTATSGTPPAQQTIPGGTDAVLLATNSGSLAESNHTFVGWNTAANGTGTLYAPYSPPTLPSPYALYNASSWNSATSTWVDLSGNSNDATSTGAPVLTTISATAGSSKTFATLGGTTSDGIKFNNPQLTNYTLCYVARYSNAGAESRIFDSSTQNWLSGFFGGNTGDFYHGTGWVSSSSGSSNTNFNVMCDSGNNVFSQGVNRDSTPQTETYLPAGLTINNGISSQPSYWQVAEVALYNSALTVDQIQQEEMYLREKYGITAATPVIPTYVSTSANLFNTYTSTSGNATLYAQWNSLVTYDPNGATSGTVPPSQNFVDSLPGTLAANTGTLAKTGYTFSGWNTAADGTGTSYAASSAYTSTGNITLYAQWSSLITFSANGGTGSPSVATALGIGSTPVVLAGIGTMAKSGYAFIGWNTSAAQTGSFYPIGSTSYIASGNATLYADWATVCTPITTYISGYVIQTFSTNGACAWTIPTGVTSVDELIVGGGAGGGAGVNNYYFGEGGGGGQVISNLAVTVTPNSVAPVVVGAAGAASANGSASYFETATAQGGLTANAITTGNAGAFGGASGNGNAGGNGGANGGAGCTPGGCGAGGGGGAGGAGSGINGGVGVASSLSGTSVNYGGGGAGHTATGAASGTYVAGGGAFGASGTANTGGGGGGGATTGGSGVVVIRYAAQFTVSFSANGGTGAASPATVTQSAPSTAVTLSAQGTIAYNGYTFAGWNTAADGSGTSYAVGASFTPVGNVTLYAQWAGNQYTITYHANGATSGTVPAPGTYTMGGSAYQIAGNTGNLALGSYSFGGWNSASNNSGAAYQPGLSGLPTPIQHLVGSNYNATSKTWADSSGAVTPANIPSTAVNGTPTIITNAANTNGSTKTFTALSGTTADGLKLGNAQLNNYTLCAVARYTGGTYGRIFNADVGNWLTGWYNANIMGTAYHNGWLAGGTTSSAADTNWHIDCDYGANLRWDGVQGGTGGGVTYLPPLTINWSTGGCCAEPTNWAVADVLLYNSTLTVTQIQQIEAYYKNYYGLTAVSSATPAGLPTYSTPANIDLYAVWNSTITYNANGSTSGTAPAAQLDAGSVSTALAANSGTLAKTGFTFGGWNTAADGSGTSYPASSTYVPTGNITLYAQWNSVITFNTNNANSGAASPATISATGSAAVTLATQGTMVRTGYTFLGWATTAGATTAAYASGASYVASSGAVTLYAVWSANTYAIIYNANGASGSMSNQAITAGTAATLTANAFTRTGYTFTGWYTTANGTGGTAYAAGASVTLYAGTTLYAQWSANSYQITFFPNYAIANYKFQTIVAGTPVALSANTWTRTGYTFAGWSTTSGPQSVVYTDAQTVTLYGAVSLYDQWTANVYTLTYSPNGATGAASVASQNWTYGSNAISSFPTVGTLSRTGYTFAGWSATPTGTTALTTPYTPTASATLYAIWTPQPQTVTYNGNGSTSGSMSNQTITAGSAAALSANAFVKTGYSFTGWNTAADGSGATSYTNSQSVTIYAPVTLYAQWTILAPAIPTITATVGNTTAAITITSSQAGTTTAGAPSSYTVTAYSGAMAAATCTVIPSATSCTIIGLTNGTAYTFKAVATNTSGSATSLASSALTPAPFTVSYSAGVGSASTTPANTTYNAGTPVTLPAATATGYTFLGWYTAATGGTFVGTPNASYSPSASVTLYAQWTALSYTITYLANGGANSVPSAGSFTTGGSYYAIASAGSLSKGGYTFSGWNTAADGSGTSYAAAAHYSTSAALTLYAQWSAVSESVTYALGGGTGTLPTQASLTIGQTFTVASGSALSYTAKNFSGWSDGTNTYLPGATYTIGTTTVTLTALWVPVQYVVTYATNSGSGNAPVDITHASGDQVTVLAATGVTRTGYSFAGWSNGTTTYAPSATFTMPASNITLTAQWTPLTYTITYSPNGASGSPSRASDSFVNGSPAIGLPTVGSMVKLGYFFGGWSDTNTVYTDTYTATASITLNAVWSPSTFAITYNNNGGSGTSSGPAAYTTGTAGLTLSAITGVAKSGYGLSGWSTTANGTILASPFVPTANTTLYAIWGPAPIAISFAAGIVPDTGSVPLPAATSVQFGASYSLPASDSSTVTSSSSNYAFAGWNDGTSTYKTGASYVMGPNPVTFTAQWVKIYNLHFVFNGGSDGSGQLVDHQYLNNDTASIPSASPSRVGYSFTGWLDQSGTSVSPGSSTYVVTDGHYILYAQWSALPYAVTYDPAGGTPTPASTTYTIGQQFSLASGVSRTGFSFTGWSDTSTVYGAGANYTMPAAPVTFTAQWSANSYQLSYDINGAGSGPIAGGPHVYNESVTVTSVVPVRTGYTFLNWSYGGSTYAPGSQIAMPASDATLTAQWSLASFGVTYDLAGGGSTLPTQGSVAFGATFTLASTPTYANRTFLGWGDGTSTYTAGATYTMGTNAVTLTAQWSGATYAVTYSISGGTGTVPSAQVKAPATSINLADSTGFTKSGFTFSSWSDGVHTYASNASFTVPSANTALIAVWAVALPVTPTAPTAVAGNGSATISLGTPAVTGGGAPTSYTMTAYNGSTAAGTCTVTSPATSCVIAGLTNGTAYTFTATANNSTGSSSPSAPSAPVTPATVPNPPTNVVVTPGPQKAIITFDPAVNNGSPVTSYTVYASTGQTCTVNAPFTPPIGCTITGLTNGTPVDFAVTATNAVGTSVPSPDPTTTPADVPLAPAAVTATSVTGTTASVSITAPTSDGGNAIINYTITATSTNGNSPVTLTIPAAAISSASILTGLTPGATYTVGVVATNQVGSGPSASASPITQPAVAPSAPAITSATSSASTTATINVSAPTSTGSATATITGYTATITPVGGGAAVTATSSTTAISATGLLPGTAYSVVVSATNSSSLTGAASSATTFTTPIGVTTSVATLSTTYGTTITPITTTIAASSPTGTTYSIAPTLPASLSFNSSTGTISGTVTTAQSATNYTITAHATITGGGTATGTAVVSIAIAATVPAAPATVSGAVLTSSTAAITIAASPNDGGSAITKYTITATPTSGTPVVQVVLPGAITSPVTLTGLTDNTSYTISVVAKNTVGVSASTTAAASVTTPEPTPTVVSVAPSSGVTTGGTSIVITGTNFASATTVSVGAQTCAVTAWTSTTLTCTTPFGNSGAVDVVVTNPDLQQATLANGFTYFAPLSATAPISSLVIEQGAALSAFAPVTANGGQGTITYSISPTPLPAGLSFDPATGKLSGTPTGSFTALSLTVTATDGAGATASSTFTLTSDPAITSTTNVASTTMIAGTAAVSFTPVTASAGSAPYTYSATGLPAGLSIDPLTGVISGTPTTAHSAVTVTVTATDSLGGTTSATTLITVLEPLSAHAASTSTSLVRNQAASFTQVSALGGSGGNVFTIAPTLPAGMTFDSNTGLISGSPTTITGAATFTVTITDSMGESASASFSLAVLTDIAPLTSSTNTANISASMGTAITPLNPINIAGGTAPITYSIAPTLPAGLSLDPTTGVISGTPTGLSSSTTYTVTATDSGSPAQTTTATFTLEVDAVVVPQAASVTPAQPRPTTPVVPPVVTPLAPIRIVKAIPYVPKAPATTPPQKPSPASKSGASRGAASTSSGTPQERGTIYFASGSAALSAQEKAALKQIAAQLNQAPGTQVILDGFTDITGGTDNLKLSIERAQSVLAYLRTLVKNKKIRAAGFASKNPVVAGESPAALARNRRVEIYTK